MSHNTFNLDLFYENLFDWINQFRLDSNIGNFRYKPGQFYFKNKPSLYGSTDMFLLLKVTNMLDEYFKGFGVNQQEQWIRVIQKYQHQRTGWFMEGLWNHHSWHFKEHSTAYACIMLKLLDAKPKYPIKFINRLNTKEKVEKWLKKGPEWGLLLWMGSHRGGGIAATIIATDQLPHPDFFDWYFDWLDRNIDSKTGFWRIGWNHNISQKLNRPVRSSVHELGGAIHYFWIYEFLKHPYPYPEAAIDSTLQLQHQNGLWGKQIPYCVDFDGLFVLTRMSRQAKRYRKEEIEKAVLKYTEQVTNLLNQRNFLFSNYHGSHKLPGALVALAEVQKYYPNMLKTPKPLIQTIDLCPWV